MTLPSNVNANIFVIGATGYIGSKLFSEAKKFSSVYGTTSSNSDNFLTLRLEENFNLRNLNIGFGDTVLIAASISRPDVCDREYSKSWLVNVKGTSLLIKNLIDCGARSIFFSSDTVYGERQDEFDEKAACNPVGRYSEMKHEVEQRFAGNALFKSIRLSYVFSREDKFSSYLIRCAERNEEADLFHPLCRAIVHRNDVVEGVLALTARWDEFPQQVINFGGPQVLSRIEFAECLRETHLHDLRFRVKEKEADADFFKNRPRVIAMMSPVFSRLLGRPPRSLREAAAIEFATVSNTESFL